MQSLIRIAVLAVIGLVGGYFVPGLTQRVLDYKGKQKNKAYPAQPGYMAMPCKLICATVSGVGLGLCAYAEEAWYLLLAVTLVWLVGAVVFLTDVRVRIIPNEAVLALLVLGGVLRVLTAGVSSLLNSLLTMLGIMVVWLVLGGILGHGSVGAGDVKLCGVIGFLFGVPGVVVPVLVMAGSMLLYIVIGLMTRRLRLKSYFPMGPFLVAGMLVGLPYMLFLL